MDSSLLQVKKALTEKAATKSLDQLQSEGRKQVRVITARNIAQMISAAVENALADSDHVSSEEVARLQEKSRKEFQDLLQARQAEHTEVESLRARVTDRDQRIQELEGQLAAAQEAAVGGEGAAPGAPAGGANADMVMALMQEVANLKAGMQGGAAPATGAAPAAGGEAPDLAGALDKIAGTLNERLEQFGKKMGISSAVDAGEVDYSALFKDEEGKGLESNMDNVKVKSKQGGGIGANLARLKKLKGGD